MFTFRKLRINICPEKVSRLNPFVVIRAGGLVFEISLETKILIVDLDVQAA